MTQQALERVIAEQQRRIDDLQAQLQRAHKTLADTFDQQEKLVDETFLLMADPANRHMQKLIRDRLREMGWCPHCERRPCECDDE